MKGNDVATPLGHGLKGVLNQSAFKYVFRRAFKYTFGQMFSYTFRHTFRRTLRPALQLAFSGGLVVVLSACATIIPVKQTGSFPIDIAKAPIAQPEPKQKRPIPDQPDSVPPIPDPHSPPPIIDGAPISPIPDGFENGFAALTDWPNFDARPALAAFLGSCDKWQKRKPQRRLHKTISDFGTIQDWLPACRAAKTQNNKALNNKALNNHLGQVTAEMAREFFQTNFALAQTLNRAEQTDKTGMLTGYYAPEIEVRRQASIEFYEPVLARPALKSVQNLPRAELGPSSSTVLAYGRPIDVFFLQIQGSGRIRFQDGTRYRAAFDGHNGQAYQSIGKILVERGEMTLSQASKQSIENWMQRSGPQKTKALINENPRYVFFKTEHLIKGRYSEFEGPKGAMGVPLTAMASIAIDPKTTGYGALIWLETRLPQKAKDYKAARAGLLVVAQDTGGAIKGRARADLYFGAGVTAGDLAGVMKHDARWTYLLPTGLAYRLSLLIS